METLSLFAHCQECGSACCKASTDIGVPILSKEEADVIIFLFGKEVLNEVTGPTGEKYWLPKDRPGSNICIFLKDNKCLLQFNKPMDCQCYPVKAIYIDDQIIYVVDTACLAAPKLTDDFIVQAKQIALISIQRFQPETYNDWLEKYIGWIKNSAQILK